MAWGRRGREGVEEGVFVGMTMRTPYSTTTLLVGYEALVSFSPTMILP